MTQSALRIPGCRHYPRIAATAIALMLVTALRARQSPLRYDFQTGDRLVYERRAIVASLETGAVQQQITEQIDLWCIDHTRDDALILLDLIRISGGKVEPMCGVVLSIDPRGNRRIDPTMLSSANDVESAFDLIPAWQTSGDKNEAWTTPPDAFGRSQSCTLKGVDPERDGHVRIGFRVDDPTGVNNFLGQERYGTIWFDRSSSAVSRVETELRIKAARVMIQSKTKLQQRTRNDSDWSRLRAAESARFRLAMENQSRLMADLTERPVEADSTLNRLDRIWAGLLADIGERSGSPFRPLALGCQQRVSTAHSALRGNAEYAKSCLGTKAPDWRLQDERGNSVRSSDFRGAPCIELLWRSNSFASIHTLDIMRALQSRVSGIRVAPRMLCMNMDRDVEVAKRAIRDCGRDLPHVLAEPLLGQSPPPDFPTVRILDRDGAVRHILTGWRSDLADAIIALIESDSNNLP